MSQLDSDSRQTREVVHSLVSRIGTPHWQRLVSMSHPYRLKAVTCSWIGQSSHLTRLSEPRPMSPRGLSWQVSPALHPSTDEAPPRASTCTPCRKGLSRPMSIQHRELRLCVVPCVVSCTVNWQFSGPLRLHLFSSIHDTILEMGGASVW